MPLPKADQDKIKALGIDYALLEAAIKADIDTTVPIPEGTILTDAQLLERDTVKVNEGKGLGESSSKSALVQEVAKKMNITVKGDRIGDLVTSLNTEIAKGADEKYKLATDQVTALTADKAKLESDLAAKDGVIAATKFDSELINMFPVNRGKDLTDGDRLSLIQRDITFETVDGKRIAKRNGEVIKDPATHAPLAIDKVITNLFTEKPILLGTVETKGGGGRGAGDKPAGGGSGGFKKASEVREDWKSKNPDGNVMGPECLAEINKVAKEDTTFDYYS